MTFNDDVRLDTSTTRSGGGRRRIAVGGGAGGLLIALVAVFLGVDPGDILGSGSGGSGPGDTAAPAQGGFDTSQCRTGADANRLPECRAIGTGNSLDTIWPTLVADYSRPSLQLFGGQIQSGCGAADSSVGPFYCPADQTVYLDVSFYGELESRFGASAGELAQEYVVAHEYGHHVQNLQGTLGRAQQGAQGAEGNGVRTELQADCYAGVWAHHAAVTPAPGSQTPFLEPLTDAQISDALSAAAAVGDDNIQERTSGRVDPDSWSHGSSEQRQEWFTTGFRTGDPASCDTLAARGLG